MPSTDPDAVEVIIGCARDAEAEAYREAAWIRQDDRCRLPFRVMVTWECYDCWPVEEIARFALFTDAREFVRMKGYRWLSQHMKKGLRSEIPEEGVR